MIQLRTIKKAKAKWIKTVLLIIIAPGLLISCSGQNYWYKKGESQADFNFDSAQCDQMAENWAQHRTVGENMNLELYSKAYNNCLTDMGWSRTPPDTDQTSQSNKTAPETNTLIQFDAAQKIVSALGLKLNLPANATLRNQKTSALGPVVQKSMAFNLPPDIFLSLIAQKSLGVVFDKEPYPAASPYFVYERGSNEFMGSEANWTIFCGPFKKSWVGGFGVYIFPGFQERLIITMTRILPPQKNAPPESLQLTRAQFREMEKFRASLKEIFPGLIPQKDSPKNWVDYSIVPN